MMTIRKEQMDSLDAYMMRQYENRVLRRIARTFPDRYPQEGEEKTLLLIRAGVRKAAHYAIEADDDVERLLLLIFVHGLEFETGPQRSECREILQNRELPGDAKVSLIARELEAEQPRAPK